MSTSISQPTPNPFRKSGIQASQADSLERLDNNSRGILTASEADSSFTDSSGTLFSLYLSHADKHDRDQAESWKAGADGILVFTGLFATAIATFVVDSYKTLSPDSARNAVVLLAQISQQIEGLSNGTHVPITAVLAPFSAQSGARQSSPPASAVWINSLWFLSLVVSLFCALLATLQQRWARRYLQLTQPPLAVHKRAHIRSFFADGVTRFHMHVTVEAIPALLHISVFLFLVGLVISLFTIHHTVAYISFSAIVVFSLVYTAITMMPVIYHDSPYTSPFSTPAWYISRKAVVAVLNAVDWVVNLFIQYKGKFAHWRSAAKNITMPPLPDKVSSYKPLVSTNMTRAVYEAAFRPNTERDARALGWTLDRLDEEGELVKFAAGIPGFSHSLKVKESVTILEKTPASSKLHRDLDQHITSLLIRALKPGVLRDSKLLPESVRQQRVKICTEALYYLPHAIENILKRVIEDSHDRKVVHGFSPVLQSVESWLVAERLSGATTSLVNPTVKIVAQCMVTVIASQPPPEKQSLSILMRYLKIKEPDVLDLCLDPFDNLLLRNLNHFLMHTAQGVIGDADKQHHIDIVLLTVRLAKRLKFEHAAQELRDQFGGLRTWIQQHATGPVGKARDNAEKLLSELSSLTTDPPPSVPLASGSTARAHTSAAIPKSDLPVQTSQSPSVKQPSQSVSKVPNDAYISMGSFPTSQGNTLP